jgi:hypothetical protein
VDYKAFVLIVSTLEIMGIRQNIEVKRQVQLHGLEDSPVVSDENKQALHFAFLEAVKEYHEQKASINDD